MVKWLNLLVFNFFGKANVDALYLTSWSEIMLQKYQSLIKVCRLYRIRGSYPSSEKLAIGHWTERMNSIRIPVFCVWDYLIYFQISGWFLSLYISLQMWKCLLVRNLKRVTLRFCLYNGTLGFITPRDWGIEYLWHRWISATLHCVGSQNSSQSRVLEPQIFRMWYHFAFCYTSDHFVVSCNDLLGFA
jgi:hypothetical protein